MTTYTPYNFDKSILREYDIRGIVGETLSEKDALYVGLGFGTRLRNDGYKTLGICYDGRHSSPILVKAIIQGLNSCGISVENYGLGPSPLAYFALATREIDACISVTGSHNPPEYNGIKMVTCNNPVCSEQIQEIGNIVSEGNFATGYSKCIEINIYDEYTSRLVSDYTLPEGQNPLNIVWDAGNGVAGAVLKQLTDKLPGTHTLLFADVDGTFPNHHPDPAVEENLEDLRRVVSETNADIGIAFDGDGDRIGVIDRNGTIIWGDQLGALLTKEIVTRIPNATCIFDVKCSQSVANVLKKWGGKPLFWKTGHSLAKIKLKDEPTAQIAAELSGHICIKDGFYGHDDALYVAVRLMNIIHKFGDLSELVKLLPEAHSTPEIRFKVPRGQKFALMDNLKSNLSEDSNISILDIDGVRVTTDNGWFLIRASNTENALTIRAESETMDGFTAIKQQMFDELDKVGASVPQELR